MSGVLAHLESVLAGIRDVGLYRVGRVIADPQGVRIAIEENGATNPAVSLCANNYLGLRGFARMTAGTCGKIVLDWTC